MASTKEILERATEQAKEQFKPSREQMEANVQIAHNWITALRKVTLTGVEAIHIAGLLGFLQSEHDKAVKDYQEQLAKHPEWANTGDVRKGPVG